MIKKSIFIIFILLLTVALVSAAADKKSNDETVKCAVSGEKIKKSEAKSSYEYKGKTYYFCCDNCKESFVKEPEKYVKKMGHPEHAYHEHDGMVVDPVCNMEFKKEKAKATHEYNGKTYYFCTEKCKDKFVKNPGQYVRADDKVMTCPVSGESFKKSEMTESAEYNSKTYYFCCPGCKEKFEADPEKYIKENK
ncbi:YHS domain-containing protein [Acidobacteriota bacterium]